MKSPSTNANLPRDDYVDIQGVRLLLSQSHDIIGEWIGQEEVLRHRFFRLAGLLAAIAPETLAPPPTEGPKDVWFFRFEPRVS